MLLLWNDLCVQVPRVFINGNCIGGGSDTKQLHQQGKLVPLIEQCAPCCATTSLEDSGSGQSAKWLTVLVVFLNPVFIKSFLDLMGQFLHCTDMFFIYLCALETWCLGYKHFNPVTVYYWNTCVWNYFTWLHYWPIKTDRSHESDVCLTKLNINFLWSTFIFIHFSICCKIETRTGFYIISMLFLYFERYVFQSNVTGFS